MQTIQSSDAKAQAFENALEEAGLSHCFSALKGSDGAVQLQHVAMLKSRARESREALLQALAASGVDSGEDRAKLATLLSERLTAQGGLRMKPPEGPRSESSSEAWKSGVANAGGELLAELAHEAEVPDHTALVTDECGDTWPAGMKIVNGHLARSIREQGMLQAPNSYGYIHLAGEVERPGLFKKTSPVKAALLASLKSATHVLSQRPDVQRADVFDAIVIPTGSKEGRRVVDEGHHDVHIAEFDVAVLVECASVADALHVRQSAEFAAVKELLDGAASFVHCATFKNPKRIAEVDKERDGIFLFNYFFAADIESKGAKGVDILLAVWEFTAGWWTAKANLTNSTPLQPLPGERSEYSLINHCRWDNLRAVVPSLIFKPSLEQFVLKNFTANDIMAMPVLYRLA